MRCSLHNSPAPLAAGLVLLLTLLAQSVAAQEVATPPAPATTPAPPEAPPAAPYVAPQPVAPQPSPAQFVQPYAPQYANYTPRRGRREVIGYRRSTRNPPALWATGLALFLAGYVLDFAILTPIANALSTDRAGADEQDAWAWSLIPVAGPIIQLGIGAPHPAIPIATGLLQIGGLVLFAVGLTSEETVDVPIYQGSPEDPSMLRVGLDAAPLEGGASVQLTLTHL